MNFAIILMWTVTLTLSLATDDKQLYKIELILAVIAIILAQIGLILLK